MTRAQITFEPSAVVKVVTFLMTMSFFHPRSDIVMHADWRGVRFECAGRVLELERA